jgi:hypothetical protein
MPPEDEFIGEVPFHIEQEVKRLSRSIHALNNSLQGLSLAVTELRVKMYFMMKFITGAGMAVVSILVGILIWFLTTGVRLK